MKDQLAYRLVDTGTLMDSSEDTAAVAVRPAPSPGPGVATHTRALVGPGGWPGRTRSRSVYLNFLGEEGGNRVRQAHGARNYERLVGLKRAYDPTNLFRPNQKHRALSTGALNCHAVETALRARFEMKL